MCQTCAYLITCHHFLGNTYNIDRALPFGLCSALKIFSYCTVADCIVRMLACQVVNHQLHYLDDVLLHVVSNLQQGCEFLAITLQTLAKFGIPVVIYKTEGPTTIVIDTYNSDLQLLLDKLTQLIQTIPQWVLWHTCTFAGIGVNFRPPIPYSYHYSAGSGFLRQICSHLLLNRVLHHFLHIHSGA